jgi:hypothetical protein
LTKSIANAPQLSAYRGNVSHTLIPVGEGAAACAKGRQQSAPNREFVDRRQAAAIASFLLCSASS